MKLRFCLIIGLLLLTSSFAKADELISIYLNNTDLSPVRIDISTISTIKFKTKKLVVKNNDNSTNDFYLSDIVKITFNEEGTSIEDFITYLKSEYLDAVYLQQDAYHDIDAACTGERQKYVFDKVYSILKTPMSFDEKDVARTFFLKLTQVTKDWNRVAMDSQEFKEIEANITASVANRR